MIQKNALKTATVLGIKFVFFENLQKGSFPNAE